MTADYTEPDALLTPIRAIREKCKDCCGGQLAEIRQCPVYTCPIWPYRMGHRPTDKTYADKPPRFDAPAHLPVWDGQRIVSPDERQKSLASSGKPSVDSKSGGSP
jgi:hypothetical protein